jgi:hypothetical protein
MLTVETFLGLDLGQRRDFSALAAVDVVHTRGAQRDKVTYAYPLTRELHLKELHRYPTLMPYTSLPARVLEAVRRTPVEKRAVTLAIDGGGPGTAVVDIFRHARIGVHILPVIITATGNGRMGADGYYTVSRRSLITLVRYALESKTLRLASRLDLRTQLIQECAAIRSDGQHHHDDLVMSVALALWASTKVTPGLLTQPAPTAGQIR